MCSEFLSRHVNNKDGGAQVVKVYVDGRFWCIGIRQNGVYSRGTAGYFVATKRQKYDRYTSEAELAMRRQEIKISLLLGLVYAVRMYGLFLLLPVMVLYAGDYQHAAPFLVGLALGIYGFTQACLQIPLGWLSDRVGRKPVIVFGLGIFVVGGVLAAVADSIYLVILGRAIQGGGAIASAIVALGADLCREEHRAKMNAFIGAGIGGGFLFALVSAPPFAESFGLSGIFYLSSGCGVAALLVIVFLIPNPARVWEPKCLSTSFFKVIGTPKLYTLFFGVFSLHATLAANFFLWPNAIEEWSRHSGIASWIFYLMVLVASFVFVVPFLIVGDKIRSIKVLFLSMIALQCINQALSPLLSHGVALVAGCIVFFMTFNYLEANLPALVTRKCSAQHRGLALGIFSTCQFLGFFVGAMIAGVFVGWELQSWLSPVIVVMLLLWLLLASSVANYPGRRTL